MKKILNYILMGFFAVAPLCSCTILEGPLFGGEVLTIDAEESYVVPSEGGVAVITVKSRKEWNASSSQPWCKISPASGDKGTCIMTISADRSEDVDERKATITITAGDESKSIVITQKQKDALILSSNRVEVPSGGKSVSVDISHNVDFTCEVESAAKEWIVIKSTKAVKVSTLVFDVKANNDMKKREGKIHIKNGNIKETITVYQDGAKPSIVLTQNEYVVGSEGEEIEIHVKSNVDYQMTIPQDADWIEQVKTKAMTDYTHYIRVKPNETYDYREVYIVFADKSGEVEDSVRISQVQKDAIILAQSEYVLEASETELSFEVSTNMDLQVKTSEDWIRHIPQTRALEDVTLTFELDINTTPENRSGVITVFSGELSQEIKVTQLTGAEKFTVRIEHTNSEFAVPLFSSSSAFSGIVYWGDGEYDNYVEDLRHDYAPGKSYVMTVDVWGAEEVQINDIVGVSLIDLTDF